MRKLYIEAQRRAGELMAPALGSRTTDQRRALALDTGHLLLALAARIHVSEHLPQSPEAQLEDPVARLPDVFGGYLEHLQRRARDAVLRRACNHALGRRAQAWQREATLDGLRVHELALGSDEGLRRVLEHLEMISVRERRRPSRP